MTETTNLDRYVGHGFTAERYSMRSAYGKALAELGGRHPHLVVLDADLSASTKSSVFGKAYPDRFFQMGIAESNMLGTAAGLATSGKKPFVHSFACFVVGRFEVIKLAIAYNESNVTVVGTHAGVGIGEDGYSQMGQEDLAMMRSLPNMVCVQPADDIEAAQAAAALVEHEGPAYLRIARQNVMRVHKDDYQFRIGKGVILQRGGDLTMVASGAPVGYALQAALELGKQGISVEVINMATIKPLDVELLVASASKTGAVMAIEDHSINGGLGSAVSEALGEHHPTPVRRQGLRDFGASGTEADNYRIHRLDVVGIMEDAKEFLFRVRG